MANRRHVINLHTSASTVAPGSDAGLMLGEIAVQHTPDNPALWIKMGSGETSEIYEKFIGQTEILELINNSNILGSGYTYSGLPYVNSSTTIADAFSAITSEVIKDERVTAAAINDLNTGLNRVKHDLVDDEYTIALALNDLNDRVTSASGACSERIDEDEEIVAGLINILSDRIGTVETRMTGDYIPITGYELASGTSEEELSLSEEDTVNEALGKLQKQMLDNEEAIAAGFNDVNARIGEVEEEISHNTGVTVLSGVVKTLSSTTASLSGAVEDSFNDLYDNVLPDYTQTGDTQALSATVMSISAKTSGILTLNLNGVEQGVYSPSADTTINLEAIQEITGADVLLTGYELASGSTEEELVVLATDSVNQAFGKLQKQNYDNEAVVAGALNDLDERIAALKASGASAEDIEVLSGIAEDHEERLDVLEISAATNNDLLELSGVVIDNELVTAQALIELNNKIASAASADDILEISGTVMDLSDRIASAATNDDLLELSGVVQTKDFVVAQALNTLNSNINGLSAATVNIGDNVAGLSGATAGLKNNVTELSAVTSGLVETVDEVKEKVNIPVAQTIPATGLKPNVFYNLGELTANTTFTLAAPETQDIVNHYYWAFDIGSTVPTITWPTGLTWFDGAAPVLSANKHYEVSVINNVAIAMEV